MEEKIAQLREKTHLDIPIVILSIMFSLSLDKFSFTLFHVLFVLLIITIILSKTLPWQSNHIPLKKKQLFGDNIHLPPNFTPICNLLFVWA